MQKYTTFWHALIRPYSDFYTYLSALIFYLINLDRQNILLSNIFPLNKLWRSDRLLRWRKVFWAGGDIYFEQIKRRYKQREHWVISWWMIGNILKYISSDFLFNKFRSSKYFIIQYFSIKQSLHDNELPWPYTSEAIDKLIL